MELNQDSYAAVQSVGKEWADVMRLVGATIHGENKKEKNWENLRIHVCSSKCS